MNLKQTRRELRAVASRRKARTLRRFFKTGKGGYGEGDVFIGVAVPDLRRLARRHCDLPLPQVRTLVRSHVHEERLLASLILVRRFNAGDAALRRRIFVLYRANLKHVNNWDLVDLACPHLIGGYLRDRSRAWLYGLARSRRLWFRRAAIISTFAFIRADDCRDTFAIAKILLRDREDLIHKAVGWMLREAGKRDQAAEERFLKRHARTMPRTMLRYAIERFPERLRRRYLGMKSRRGRQRSDRYFRRPLVSSSALVPQAWTR